ncbi:MAG TPA: MFS transporter [Bacteroidia bacterium]|jgi:FHS family L-fucose permease-like MFS transporter|nr:MFS transporter [Bacteroidia bacterium]
MTNNNRSSSLWVLLSVFFFWGFVAASNTVLIGLFKKNFELTQAQSQLVDLAFYFSYFVGAGFYLIFSIMFGDPLNKVGYKKGLVAGLLISAIGALCFIPAAGSQSFGMMLFSLFTIGLGFSLQQIVANPYVIALGNPETGSHRISLAGGINSFGTTIGPLLLAYALFGSVKGSDNAVLNSEMGIDPVSVNIERTTNKTQTINGPIFTIERTHSGKLPYYYLANNADSAGLAGQYEFMSSKKSGVVIVYNENSAKTTKQVEMLKKNYPSSHIPIITINNETYMHLLSAIKTLDGASMKLDLMGVEKVKMPSMILAGAFILFAIILGMSKLPTVKNSEKMEKDMGALKFPQVIYGMVAIFFYVGTEVATQSNLQALMKQENFLGLDVDKTVHYISLYWGCLMIGRWTGALRVFNLGKTTHYVMMVVVPLIAYSVILAVNYVKGSPMNDLLYFLPFVFILIAGFFIAQEKPARTMMLFGALAMLMMLIGLFTSGKAAIYCFVSCGLFCSVMWPCIFSLSTAGLGKYTTQASSLLIMMIIGGAIIPFVQGRLADSMGIHASYIVPLIGFAYLTFYGWEVKYVLQKQGLDFDSQIQSNH